jgi:N-acetylmuramoyl-L-alanine amidase
VFLLAFSCRQQPPAIVEETVVVPVPEVPILRPAPAVDTIPVITDEKLKLTSQYCMDNYGFEHYRLDTPRIVVVHYTAIDQLNATLNLFKQDHIASSREDIKDFSKLNVGIHYVVDKDGKIFHLTPDTIVARHVIGLNYVALGIENIAKDSTDLTAAQVESNALLITYLASKYPTIEYMIGHHEYYMKTLPHFKHFRALNKSYKASGKIDPGDPFMSKLRTRLAKDGVVLEK